MRRNELRSKSGCLPCRRRKKKCDETKPVCLGCNRSLLTCKWPTEEHKAMDRRYRKELSHPFTKHRELKFQGGPTLCAWDEPVLLAYYENSLAPNYMQRGACLEFYNLENVFKLIHQHETTKIAVLSSAAVSLSGNLSIDRNWASKMKDQALSYRISAVSSIQKQIKEGVVDGTEDWLLLTASQLALADGLDYDTSASGLQIHIDGVMSLLRCRQFARMSSLRSYKPSHESLIHERLAYEAILFHGTNLMLLDRSFSMLDQPWWLSIDDYFRAAPLSTTFDEASWPILGMPFDLFRLAIVAHELSRRYPSPSEDVELAIHCLLQLGFFYKHIPSTGDFSAGYTYLVATTALLRHIISRSKKVNEQSQEVSQIPDTDMSKIKENLDAGRFFVRFPLWPLIVLYRVSNNVREKEMLKRWIADALRTFSGVVSRSAPQKMINFFMMAPGL